MWFHTPAPPSSRRAVYFPSVAAMPAYVSNGSMPSASVTSFNAAVLVEVPETDRFQTHHERTGPHARRVQHPARMNGNVERSYTPSCVRSQSTSPASR